MSALPATASEIFSRSRPTLSGEPTLAGVIASSDPRFARAIFVDGAGRQVVYAVGDLISPGVHIDAIERDYVVLNRGGNGVAVRLRHGSATPSEFKLANPEPAARDGAGAMRAALGYDPVEARMEQLRANVSAAPPPLPPVSTAPLDIQRGRDSPKLAPVQRNRL